MVMTMLPFLSLSLGAIVGSFLNCIIYRLPRSLSLKEPKRSFCPECQHTLHWCENIPIISWCFLKGKCTHCGTRISCRYPCVEILTSFTFWLCSLKMGFPLMIVGWIFVSLLIVASFIDLEHLLIPDEITIGGMIAGCMTSFILPQLMGVESRWIALCYSLTSALTAYLLLWIILEIGKKIFGKKRLHWKEPLTLELFKDGEIFFLRLGEESLPLLELFSRSSDSLRAEATTCTIAHKEYSSQALTIDAQHIAIAGNKWRWDDALPLHAMITNLTLPREAMGLGDVKFLACIAAFLGVKGMLFALFGGSVIGAITGSLLLLITRGRQGRVLPFGPYLATAGLIWMLWGRELLNFL